MLKTKQFPIRKGILNHLKKKQDVINVLSTYKEQVKHAKVLWQSKKKSNAQKSAFNRVEKELKKIAIAQQYCNYCEAIEGTNIEHIYPKGFYPSKTFVWENYLWACKECNGRHKISQFQIFESKQSSNTLNLKANRNFKPPANEDAVFINPRVDNPLDYLQLNLDTGLFLIIDLDINSRAYKRAAYTLDTLKLNHRKKLIKVRQQAYQEYIHLLKGYANSPSLELQKNILTQAHPTVWEEMQRQAKSIPLLNDLFLEIPNALDWKS
jgi:uncharacterized protein (TIGR02646 family)